MWGNPTSDPNANPYPDPHPDHNAGTPKRVITITLSLSLTWQHSCLSTASASSSFEEAECSAGAVTWLAGGALLLMA